MAPTTASHRTQVTKQIFIGLGSAFRGQDRRAGAADRAGAAGTGVAQVQRVSAQEDHYAEAFSVRVRLGLRGNNCDVGEEGRDATAATERRRATGQRCRISRRALPRQAGPCREPTDATPDRKVVHRKRP